MQSDRGGKQTAFAGVIAHEPSERLREAVGRQEACVRGGGELVNKQRRWMSLLKRRLIQAIRKQSEGVREEEVTYVWLMALNTELNGVGQG